MPVLIPLLLTPRLRMTRVVFPPPFPSMVDVDPDEDGDSIIGRWRTEGSQVIHSLLSSPPGKFLELGVDALLTNTCFRGGWGTEACLG